MGGGSDASGVADASGVVGVLVGGDCSLPAPGTAPGAGACMGDAETGDVNPRLWGPLLWKVLHAVSFRVGESDSEPCVQMMECLDEVLPCSRCRSSYTGVRKALEARVGAPMRTVIREGSFARWVYELHRLVSHKLQHLFVEGRLASRPRMTAEARADLLVLLERSGLDVCRSEGISFEEARRISLLHDYTCDDIMELLCVFALVVTRKEWRASVERYKLFASNLVDFVACAPPRDATKDWTDRLQVLQQRVSMPVVQEEWLTFNSTRPSVSVVREILATMGEDYSSENIHKVHDRVYDNAFVPSLAKEEYSRFSPAP